MYLRGTLEDIFIFSYDCDVDCSNILERVVQVISSTAQDKALYTLADDDAAGRWYACEPFL